jgi:hypothetical protein
MGLADVVADEDSVNGIESSEKIARGPEFRRINSSKHSLARIELGPYCVRALCAEPSASSSAAKKVDPTDTPNGNLN